jgi:hypothetical protein
VWLIIKQSDRETMLDELGRLKPVADEADNAQRTRTVGFVMAELEAIQQDQCAINLSGSRTGSDNYLSIVMGAKRSNSAWQMNKTNLPKNLLREQLIAHLKTLSLTGQQSRAVSFAIGELESSEEAGGSINISGDPEIGFLSLSVSAAD